MIKSADCPDALALASRLLKAGELVAIPTETVYGLAADASQALAVAKIFALKQRPLHNPLIVHVADVAALSDWATNIPSIAYQLAEAFWPGPMTLILPKAAWVPGSVTAGQDSIGLRIPAHPAALALLRAFGGGLAAPSANRYTQISPTTAQHVEQAFGKDLLILDGGPSTVGIESTIIDCRFERLTILRPGMLGADAIAAVAKHQLDYQPEAELKRPGQHWLHYAPKAPLSLVPSETLKAELAQCDGTVGVIVYSEALIHFLGKDAWVLPADPDAYARGLYAALHGLDQRACQRILVELPPVSGAWYAVHERLQKSAGLMRNK